MDIKNRSFLGALAAAIWHICNLLIKTVNVANDGVSMADKAVKTARRRQAIDLGITMNDYATKATEEAALRQVKQELAMRDFIGQDEERKQLVAQARKKISEIVQRELAEIDASA